MPSPLNPTERSLRARVAAHHLHASGGTNTEPARRAFLDRFEREVDPTGVLDPAERARRAEHAKKAYMSRLALKSAQARRRRKRMADAAELRSMAAELADLADLAETDEQGPAPASDAV